MSTRWYPLYQKGGPQLRVFLPNFWMKLIKPTHIQPANVVQFHCSMEMTKYDVKNYLEKIYGVDIMEVRTRIALGRTKKDRLHGAVIKEDDRKIAYIVLPKDQSFVFPDLFKDTKSQVDEKTVNESKKDFQDYIKDNKAPGLPGWFRI
ncbi:39S ribosomal protein L23, mitochondrial [Nylanderia fulva]|uniref:39S ribosomal protein L23, mitochondrial n=1 Tax=Nylanderia fulva TaxID=613905 RepID=UPI0010FB6E7C|nr:39S ribosomal protein L23, mitochondrial [Nylanderia fulva]